MIISPKLVVGNAWLYMLDSDETKVEFKQSEFQQYAFKLKEKVKKCPNYKMRRVEVSLEDILDTASSYAYIVTFKRNPYQENPSVVVINQNVQDARSKLKRSLEVYVRGVTPDWLLKTMGEAWSPKQNSLGRKSIMR